MSEIYLNSKFIGNVDNPKEFVEKIINERRKNSISKNINVTYEENTNRIYIESSKGRLRRPLIIVKQGQSLLTKKYIEQLEKEEIKWSDLEKLGLIEYIDASEEENALIAFNEEDITEKHTHLEISPLAILGYTTSLVPYGNYNHSARLNAGSKNQKQAIGFYVANYSVRMDMDVNLLHHPQKPIVQTIMNDILKYEEHPAGQNIVVAILSYKGYNMEDAIIVNKGSVDRGFARSTYYRPYKTEELRYSGGLIDDICIPDKEVKGYRTEHDYRYLEEDGIVYPGAQVEEKDVVVGKSSPPRFLSGLDEYNLATSTRRESSIDLKHGEEGIIDFVLLSENKEGNKLVQVRVRDQRIPEVGDKFTSRHGQKGILGLVVPQENMPFTASGITPDVIFSPQGIPSRMTISHLIELIGGKVGALSGRYIDGTTFDAESEESIRKELLGHGFKENGTETMYDGITGKQMQAKIYIGDMYYLKLKHMVANKIHARARGPIQMLTKQPTEGRAKEGGLRLGEMEKDTFVAHGTSLLLKERFDADGTIVPVCEECGLIAIHNEFKNKSYCPICGDNVVISYIEVAYAFKLLLDELKSIGIYPKLKLKTKY